MTYSHAHTQLLVGALTTMSQLATTRHRQQQELAAEELRASALAHMVDAFVTHRVDVVKESFLAILNGYAEQARHFMAQQKDYADREIEATDPLKRIELRARVQKIDVELAIIRTDARLLFDRMTEVITSLGGSTTGFARGVSQTLALPSMSTGADW